MQLNTIKVDVVSDVVCPWCYIGKRRLEQAITEWTGAPVTVEYHPFELNPDLPHEGINRDTYLSNKFGGLEQVQGIMKNIEAIGLQLGIPYNFEAQQLSINTYKLHTLLHAAGKEGFKTELKERFLKAYFVDGEALNSKIVLYKILGEFNWDTHKVDSTLANADVKQEVNNELQHYKQLGVSSVPCFIINNTYSISGAQEAKVFLDVFNKVAPLG